MLCCIKKKYLKCTISAPHHLYSVKVHFKGHLFANMWQISISVCRNSCLVCIHTVTKALPAFLCTLIQIAYCHTARLCILFHSKTTQDVSSNTFMWTLRGLTTLTDYLSENGWVCVFCKSLQQQASDLHSLNSNKWLKHVGEKAFHISPTQSCEHTLPKEDML